MQLLTLTPTWAEQKLTLTPTLNPPPTPAPTPTPTRTRTQTLTRWAKQKKARTGMWAERPTAADTKLKEMYDKYHPRLVAALTDHAWDQLLSESDARCGACSCFPFCG